MPANFNWKTEEETEWTDELEPVVETAVPILQGRWFRRLAVASLLIVLAGLVVVWQINRRAKAVTEGVEADILASYELFLSAAEDNDADLFHSLHGTDGRSSGWGRYLDQLMASNAQLINGRRPGLILLENKPQVEDIVLASDLASAELITTQTYAVYSADHVTETITLRQIVNYQLQEDGRWLMVAPDADFWGEWQTYESPRLRLSYPSRDEAITRQIITPVNEKLDQLCRWLAALPTLPPCPDDLQFQVSWRDEFDSLAALDQVNSERIIGISLDNPIIFLPAPSLVGIPSDEADEQVLIDFYVQQTMAAMIRKLQDSENYDWYHFYRFNMGALDRFLVGTGIKAWPPPAIPGSDSGSPPIPWPEQAIALTCLDETGQNASLVRLEPENETWSTESVEDGLVDAKTWPDGRVLLQYWTGSESSWVMVEPDDTRFPVPATDEPVEYLYEAGNGRYLVAPVSSTNQNAPYSHYYALDWEQCRQGNCQWYDLPGSPTWSPDGSQLLLQVWPEDQMNGQILYGQDLNGPFNQIAEGTNPVWLDDKHYSYRYWDPAHDWRDNLMVAQIGNPNPTVVLSSANLESYLPKNVENVSSSLFLMDTKSNLLLVNVNQFQTIPTSSDALFSQNYLLFFDYLSGEMAIVAEEAYLGGVFADNGRTLIITRLDGSGTNWALDRYDIAQKETETLIQYDTAAAAMLLNRAWGTALEWSEDGQWLLAFRDGFLILLAPDYNYKRIIAPETPGCFNATWIKP